MNRINRRQRVTPKVPKREPGQRAGLRPKARQQFIDDRRIYKGDMQNNQIFDEMARRAKTRGQTLDGISDLEYGLLEGQVVAERAAKKALPYAALGGIAAAGAGYAMNGGQQFAGVGTDPLAQARNSVAKANALLGSERMLEAAALDQIDYMQQQQQAADDVEVNQFNQQVSQMVDARAQELQSVPIQKSDGTVAPMGFDTAIRLAQEEVGLQLRAQGIV